MGRFLSILGSVAGLSVIGFAATAQAKDYGKVGSTWQIAEPDMLEVIKARLANLQQSGQLADFQRKAVDRAKNTIIHPAAVAGITHAYEDRSWTYDPTITVGDDIKDGKGNLIAAKGQRFNPLDHIALSHDLVFVDGDSKSELSWAMKQGDPLKVWIVMVKGSPIERMKEFKRRFFFDQRGSMTEKLGVAHTPALVRQKGNVVEIKEFVINRSADL